MLDRLSFRFNAKLPLMLQTEATECGLACLGMVAGYHGYRTDLATLRRRYPISLKGATLGNLISIANQLELATRPLKLDIEDLAQLKLPCVLHWDFNHFVVLQEVGSRSRRLKYIQDLHACTVNELGSLSASAAPKRLLFFLASTRGNRLAFDND